MTRESIQQFLRSKEVDLPGWAESAEHLAGVERLLASPDLMAMLWRPIDAAPNDADLLLLWQRGDRFPRTGFWDEDAGLWISFDAGGEWPIYPEIWMPLPAARFGDGG
jgi:hypothetical protein